MQYRIKQQAIYEEPIIDLPEGSQLVSVEHRDEWETPNQSFRVPECWTVTYLEPIKGL